MGDLDHIYQGRPWWRNHLRMLVTKSEMIRGFVPHLRSSNQTRAAYHWLVGAVCIGEEARVILSCHVVDHATN